MRIVSKARLSSSGGSSLEPHGQGGEAVKLGIVACPPSFDCDTGFYERFKQHLHLDSGKVHTGAHMRPCSLTEMIARIAANIETIGVRITLFVAV
jgi:hypothetical protein